MPSPFPGVDPFLEAQGYREEFHRKYINDVQATGTPMTSRYGCSILMAARTI